MSEFECPHPDCEGSERTFVSERSMKVHHSHAHGESIAKKETQCEQCDDVFEYYPSIKDGILCSDCLKKGFDPVQDRSGTNPHSVKKKEVKCTYCNDTKQISRSDYEEGKNHFCNQKCYDKHRKERNLIDTKCDQCNDDITLSKTRYDSCEDNFCDKECRLEFQRNSVKIFCHYCGSSEKRPKSRVVQSNRCFCSRDCQQEYRRENRRINVNCDECGDEITKIKSRYLEHESHFCSDSCQYKNYTKDDKLDYDRYGRGWIGTREDVRERDNYECQICGKDPDDIGRIPSAHHITPLSWFYNHEDYSIEDAHYMENLVLLCPSHHQLIENGKLSLIDELRESKVDILEFEPPWD